MNMEIGDGFEALTMLPEVSQTPDALPAGTAGNAQKPEEENGPGREAALKVADGEDVRMEKVAAIRGALAAGSYRVSASAVATKMLNQMMSIQREWPRRERRKRPRVGHRGLMRGNGNSGRLYGAARRWRG